MKAVCIACVEKAPDIDGELSQPVWQQANWYGDFCVVNEPETKANHEVSFAMVHDGKNLYIAGKVEDLQMAQWKADMEPDKRVEQDWPSIWRNDVDIFIDAEGLNQTGLQVTVNCMGEYVTRWMLESGHVSWNYPIRCCSQMSDTGWSVQVELPLAGLKFGGTFAEQWKINLVHIRMMKNSDVSSPEFVTFAPIRPADGCFWSPKAVIASAVVEDLSPELLWSVKPAGRARDEDTSDILNYNLTIRNLAKAAQPIDICCRLEADGVNAKDIVLSRKFDPEQTLTEQIKLPLPTDVNGNLHVTLTNPVTSKEISRNKFFIDSEPLSWKEHFVLQRDGKGGRLCHNAQFRFMPHWNRARFVPFGLAKMDNGEIVIAGVSGTTPPQTLVAFSKDKGANWSDYIAIQGSKGRPMMLAYLGNGELTFSVEETVASRYLSCDYGRSWKRIGSPPTSNGHPFYSEGCPLVDYDENGIATAIAETGFNFGEGTFPDHSASEFIRWSRDGARTWEDESRPQTWQWEETHKGKTYPRSCCEGSLVRAANGWIVAALRMDAPARFFCELPFFNDGMEGAGVSISKNNGKTWSKIEQIFEPGRHHPDLICLPNGDLVMTVIRRIDIQNDELAGYRRGCDAIISRDNGLTWDVDKMYILDDFAYLSGENWVQTQCGHLCSLALDDGSVLTAYGNFSGGALIHWRP